jgi:hypothetical protein
MLSNFKSKAPEKEKDKNKNGAAKAAEVRGETEPPVVDGAWRGRSR